MRFSIISEHAPTCSLTQSANQSITTLFASMPSHKHFQVASDTLNPCIGCFSCWLKTPGKCCFKDLSDEISTHMVQDDFIIFVTPIRYGCYSPAIKKVLDRSVPNILPFFTKIKHKGRPTEIHHVKRYKKIASHVMIAYSESITPAEEATFIALTKANSVNFHISSPIVYICRTSQEIDAALLAVKNKLSKEELFYA